jgi:hypothetical protein
MGVIRDDAEERMARIEAILDDLRRKTADLSDLAEKTAVQLEESRAFRHAADQKEDGGAAVKKKRTRARQILSSRLHR